MANGQGKTVHPGFSFKASQLCPDTGSGHFAVIEEHIPPGGFYFVFKRHFLGHRCRCRATVNKVKHPQRPEDLHQPGHLLRFAGEEASHVVIQTRDTGDFP